MRNPHIVLACELTGSQAALAREIRVTRAFVFQMLRGDKQVPAEHCPSIERATDGQVRCEDLRPDVDWSVLRCQHDASSSEVV